MGAREASELAAASQSAASSSQADREALQQLRETVAMAAEEALCRQVDGAMQRQRLSGALEESRRALRNSLGLVGPTLASADQAAKVARLEAQVAELQRRIDDQARELGRKAQGPPGAANAFAAPPGG